MGKEQTSTFCFLSGHITANNPTCNKTSYTSPLHNFWATQTLTFFQFFSGHPATVLHMSQILLHRNQCHIPTQ